MITSRAFYKSVAHALRRTALPLAAYYRHAGGAGRQRRGAARLFRPARAAVLAVPPIGILLACAVHAIVGVCGCPVMARGHAPR